MRSPGEALLEVHLAEIKGSVWVSEFRFSSERKWRADFAEIDKRILVEVEGSTWNGGRHVTGAGFAADCEKYNEAVRLGWRVLRFTTSDVQTGRAKAMVEAVIQAGV